MVGVLTSWECNAYGEGAENENGKGDKCLEEHGRGCYGVS